MIIATEETLTDLPKELALAQRAIMTAEVQEIIRKLARFNLGVYMPHLHKAEAGFYPLPDDMVAVEEKMVTRFVSRADAEEDSHRVPTAWRWIDEEAVVSVASKCRWYNCY